MALDEHLPNGDKTILALQLVRNFFKNIVTKLQLEIKDSEELFKNVVTKY